MDLKINKLIDLIKWNWRTTVWLFMPLSKCKNFNKIIQKIYFLHFELEVRNQESLKSN